jgi:hypothetical protein
MTYAAHATVVLDVSTDGMLRPAQTEAPRRQRAGRRALRAGRAARYLGSAD